VAGKKRTGERWEYLRALGRLVLSLPPWRKWPTVSGYVIAIGGAVAVPMIGLITRHLLPTVAGGLAVLVVLLVAAGTRLERQLHGDSGIQIELKISGQRIQLGVRNGRGKSADFTGTVENIEPAPPNGRPLGWAIPWLSPSGSSQKSIPPHGLSYLSLGHGDITRRKNDEELAGCAAFHVVGESEIPFNYENTDAVMARGRVTVTVRVQRHDPPAAVEADFLVEYPVLDGPFPMYPTITLVGEPRPTRG